MVRRLRHRYGICLYRTARILPELRRRTKDTVITREDSASIFRKRERRAKTTVQYVISKGISKDRIAGQGFGESELKVDCKKCSEEEHSKNRRSEFLIVKNKS